MNNPTAPSVFTSPDTEVDSETLEDPNASSSLPPQASLQWISVGKGGKVDSVRTVRSHVSREHHQRQRHSKKASLVRLTKTRRARLRPGRIVQDGDIKSSPEQDIDSEKGSEKATQERDISNSDTVPVRRNSNSISPSSIVYNHAANLIPYAWFEKDGPILYVNRLRWPFPIPFNVTGSDRSDLTYKNLTPRQSGWTPAPKRANDVTGVKGAVLDPNVLLWIGQSPECFQFRVETIRWIQGRLEDPLNAINNNTIASIMTFAMWTAGYGNPVEMSNHMDAVERIVNLRGGFHSFQDDRTMIAKLTLFDSMIAIQTGQTPRFPPIKYLVAYPIDPTLESSMSRYESPLHGCGNFAKTITYPKDQETIITLLNRLWTLTQKFDIETRNESRWESTDAIPFTTYPQAYYTIPLLTLPLLSHCRDPTHNHVLETLLSAGVIYSRSLTHPSIDLPSSQNDTAFQDLCISFSKCSSDDFWDDNPGVLLWVLLVGTAASRAKKDAAFWMFYLSRTGSFSTPETWLMGSAAIRRFLELQMWMREAAALQGG